MKAYTFEGEMGTKIVEHEIPSELQADAEMYRAELVERVVEHDDALMEAYLGGELPTQRTNQGYPP
jgi:elongation factor G